MSRVEARNPDDLLREVQETRRAVEALFAETAEERLVRRPAEAAWSVVEHLDHLVRVNGTYLEHLDPVLEEARARGLTGSGPFRGSWLGRLFARSQEPPVTRRMKTLPAMAPASDLDPAATLDAFLEVEEELRSRLERSQGLDLDRIRMTSPFLPRWLRWIRAPVFSWLCLLTAHDRRHLWLMRETLERLE